MKDTVSAEIGSTPQGGYLDRKLASQRRKLFDAFLAFKGDANDDSILDVCMAPIHPIENTSYLQAWLDPAQRSAVSSCKLIVSRNRPWRAAGAEAVQGDASDGQTLPYQDGQFDWVFCNEVIEHAGSRERQLNLLRELARVAKKGVFVTTENRRHPIEFNTGLPLLHWLPESLWRKQLALVGKSDWASESVLNPLGSDTLQEMAATLPGCAPCDIGHLRVAGVKAHFFMMLRKA